MARGGYRKPPATTPPGGPGRFSRRTDGQQPIRTPKLSDPEVQYGDIQKMREGQKIAPLPSRPPVDQSQRPEGAPLRADGKLPDFLFGGESNRPQEPVTEGLPIGPGAGPEVLNTAVPPEDMRELTLLYLSTAFGNRSAYSMLEEIQNEKTLQAQPTSQQEPVSPLAGEDEMSTDAISLGEDVAPPEQITADEVPPLEDTEEGRAPDEGEAPPVAGEEVPPEGTSGTAPPPEAAPPTE